MRDVGPGLCSRLTASHAATPERRAEHVGATIIMLSSAGILYPGQEVVSQVSPEGLEIEAKT